MFKLLITLLVSILLIDPSDKIFHLKVPVFLLLWIVTLSYILLGRLNFTLSSSLLLIVSIVILIPLPSIIIGYMSGELYEVEQWSSYVKTFLLGSLLLVVVISKVNIDYILVKTSIIISLLTIIVWTISFLYPESYIIIYNFLCIETDTIIMSKRSNYGIEMTMIFYKTSPILIFTLGYYLHKLWTNKIKISYIVSIILVSLSIFMSATRANIIAAILIIFFTISSKMSFVNKLKFYTSLLVFILFFLSFNKIEKSDDNLVSDDIKTGHIESIFNLFQEKKYILLVGQGPGSYFYSKGSFEFTNKTEVTYLEFIRIFGLPIFLIFMIILLKPFYDWKRGYFKGKEYLLLSYFLYLLIAATNPLIVSSTGFLIIVTMLSIRYLVLDTGKI